MPNSTIYEKFGYDLPKDFGEVAEMCNYNVDRKRNSFIKSRHCR